MVKISPDSNDINIYSNLIVYYIFIYKSLATDYQCFIFNFCFIDLSRRTHPNPSRNTEIYETTDIARDKDFAAWEHT